MKSTKSLVCKTCWCGDSREICLQKGIYLIEGRHIFKKVRKLCEKCRCLMKKSIEIALGANITIAPCILHRTNRTGPVLAYSNHNKRKPVQIWLAVFCQIPGDTKNKLRRCCSWF